MKIGDWRLKIMAESRAESELIVTFAGFKPDSFYLTAIDPCAIEIIDEIHSTSVVLIFNL
jgi:hypothetical protein